VFPDYRLGDWEKKDFRTWREVATVEMDEHDPDYAAKFKFGRTGPLGVPKIADVHTIFLCTGERCNVPDLECRPSETREQWWAKIVSSEGEVMYRCVIRRDHSDLRPQLRRLGIEIPGTVRWRWRIDDEGLWVRCGYGCCEIK
jgi:hypothetical protein